MNDIDAGKPLALNGSLDRPLRWLIVIMIIPLIGSIVAISLGLQHVAEQARMPMLFGVAVGPLIILLALGMIIRSLKRARVYVDQGELVVKPGMGSKRIALPALRARLEINLNERTELNRAQT